MRSTTIKRLAILIAVLGLIGGTGFAVQRAQIQRMAHSVAEQADRAKKAGDLAKAEELLKQHLQNVPDDPDIQLKYANLILEIDKTRVRQEEALGIYRGILTRVPGNKEVRRRLIDLEFEMGRFASARGELVTLLSEKSLENVTITDANDVMLANKDGDLQFLMGRCAEEAGDGTNAEKFFQAAIAHKASKSLEAYKRRADVLRGRLKRPDDANTVIEAMVKSDPENYQVYLDRGRYRSSFEIKGAGDDFKKALELSPDKDKIEVYLEMAKLAEKEAPTREQGQAVARKILERELKTAPDSPALNEALVQLELRTNHVDKAIEILQRSLKTSPRASQNRWLLAIILAERGDNRGLALQIAEMRKIGFSPVLLRYLTAYENVNKNEYATALQILVPLQSDVAGNALLKTQLGLLSKVNYLLARCYSQLGESEMQREIYLQTLRDNPGDLQARLGWIAILIKQGETDRAIEEYEKLVGKVPSIRLPLARLLIARNRQRPAVNSDWSQVERLIADAAAATPESAEPSILQANVLRAQDKNAEAADVLGKARSKFPKSVEIWLAQIDLMRFQGRVEEAQKLLDQAKGQLGDLVDLRLASAQLAATKKGPEVITALNKLAQNMDHFPKDDQRKLLYGLAVEHIRNQDLGTASRLWSELARQLPHNIELRLKLLDLAFQMDDEEEIKKNIQQIEKIEGSEGLMGKYCQVRYLVLQAARAGEKSQQATKQAKDANSEADRLSSLKASEESEQRARALRTDARVLINELMSHRGDWSRIHLILAQLEEQELLQEERELLQVGLGQKQREEKEKQRKEKLESIVNSYLRAIELGQRDSNTVRRAVQLLFTAGRGNEALELYNRSSVDAQPGIDPVAERWAAQQAFRNKDFRRAEEIARKALVAKPDDFGERLLLAQILRATGRQADAESEIRNAVGLSKTNPVPWVNLVKFLAETKQLEKAEAAFNQAQTNLAQLAQPAASLTFAECCELMGRAYEGANNADAMKKWNGEAKSWFEKAQGAQPDNLSITRRLTQFFLQTKQIKDAESQLTAILKRGPGDNKTADDVAWAKRVLALTLIEKGDPESARKALTLYEPTNQNGVASTVPETPEDQRVLARVLDAQKAPDHRKRAIELMLSLVKNNPNNLDDLLLLARLYEIAGDWDEAEKQYDKLIARTENREDPGRAVCLDQFIKGLIRQSQQASEDQKTKVLELTKAQKLVDKLERLQPDELNPVILEVMINRIQSRLVKEGALKRAQNPQEQEAARKQAQKYLDDATALVQAFATRPNLTVVKLGALADQAERLGEFELAEKLLRQIEAKMSNPRGTMALAAFFGRRGDLKKAIDLCAPLWLNAGELGEVEMLTVLYAKMVLQPNSTAGPAEIKRVGDGMSQALDRFPQSTVLMVSLANIQERQGLYRQAEALYRRAIEQGDRNGIAHNNLAWLLALEDGGNLKDALEYVNAAIDLKGPLPDFLDTRGIIYLNKGENQRAIDDLEKAVAGDPSPTKYFHLAEAYLKADKVAEAKKNWEAAKIKAWEHSGLHALEQRAYDQVRSKLEMP